LANRTIKNVRYFKINLTQHVKNRFIDFLINLSIKILLSKIMCVCSSRTVSSSRTLLIITLLKRMTIKYCVICDVRNIIFFENYERRGRFKFCFNFAL